MTLRSGKRQKRRVVSSSDETSDDSTSKPTRHVAASRKNVNRWSQQPKGRSEAVVPKANSSPTQAVPFTTNETPVSSSSNTSPKKKPKLRAKAKSASTYSFFNSTTLQQTQNAGGSFARVSTIEHDPDIIQDDEAEGRHHQVRTGSRSKVSQTRSSGGHQMFGKLGPSAGYRPSTSLKRTLSKFASSSDAVQEDCRPWAERYSPSTLDELAVHKKKVADVQSWLSNVLAKKDRKRLLVLRGPAGSGKTATIHILKDLLGFDLVEWRNPMGTAFDSDSFLPLSVQFEEFLSRSGKYGCLPLYGCAESLPQAHVVKQNPRTDRKRILLLEEFPSLVTSSVNGLSTFRSSLMRFLAANVPVAGLSSTWKSEACTDISPMVILISETLATSAATTTTSEAFTAHRLLGPEILHHPGVTTLDFNPVAPTILIKALNLVARKAVGDSDRHTVPGPAVLKTLSETGDVRNAISSLEFMCIGRIVDADRGWSDTDAPQKRKVSSKTITTMKRLGKASAGMITQRGFTLDMFHAVGKVVYNKREDRPLIRSVLVPNPDPPEHLLRFSRPKVSEVDVDQLMDETGADVQTFVAALHENYVLSCAGDQFVDTLNECIDILSDSDLLGSDLSAGGGLRQTRWSNNYQNDSGGNTLRQSDICFHVAVRGLLFGLPSPVKRHMPVQTSTGKIRDSYKMFYPSSLRLWKITEETNSLVDSWLGTIANTLSQNQGIGAHPAMSVGSDWKHRTTEEQTRLADVPGPWLLGLTSTRTDMILQQLPFITKIEQRRCSDQTRLVHLQKITQFQCVSTYAEGIPEDEDVPLNQNAVVRSPTYMPLNTSSMQQRPLVRRDVLQISDVEKLVLSDDDIEDD